jgi:hypothetical protein
LGTLLPRYNYVMLLGRAAFEYADVLAKQMLLS